jgi:hypothetical protein
MYFAVPVENLVSLAELTAIREIEHAADKGFVLSFRLCLCLGTFLLAWLFLRDGKR